MLSEAKHLCLARCHYRIQINQRFFASLRMTILVTRRGVAHSLCTLRLDLDVDRNRLADAGD
jgi:hypothetical protein